MKQETKEELERFAYAFGGGLLVGMVALYQGYTADTSVIVMIVTYSYISVMTKLNSMGGK